MMHAPPSAAIFLSDSPERFSFGAGRRKEVVVLLGVLSQWPREKWQAGAQPPVVRQQLC